MVLLKFYNKTKMYHFIKTNGSIQYEKEGS